MEDRSGVGIGLSTLSVVMEPLIVPEPLSAIPFMNRAIWLGLLSFANNDVSKQLTILLMLDILSFKLSTRSNPDFVTTTTFAFSI